LAGVTTLVGLAVEYEKAGRFIAELNARHAELVLDGAADALPAASAREVMLAVGGVHHEATVAAALGLGQVEVTNAHLDDG